MLLHNTSAHAHCHSRCPATRFFTSAECIFSGCCCCDFVVLLLFIAAAAARGSLFQAAACCMPHWHCRLPLCQWPVFLLYCKPRLTLRFDPPCRIIIPRWKSVNNISRQSWELLSLTCRIGYFLMPTTTTTTHTQSLRHATCFTVTSLALTASVSYFFQICYTLLLCVCRWRSCYIQSPLLRLNCAASSVLLSFSVLLTIILALWCCFFFPAIPLFSIWRATSVLAAASSFTILF